MSRYLLASHDGFGLGHARRNALVARALLAADRDAQVMIITGLPFSSAWLGTSGVEVRRVPPLLKDSEGGYRPVGMSFEVAVRRRADVFADAVQRWQPDLVLIDRHPYGTAGELREGVETARAAGARVLLGLRDVLDDSRVVAAEMAGAGWREVTDLFDAALVYGASNFCDHEAEYGLPLAPRYCGWVTETRPPSRSPVDEHLLVVTAGGGGDGDAVFRLGVDLVEHSRTRRLWIAAGPYAGVAGLRAIVERSGAAPRVTVATQVGGCTALFARAAAVVQMAGYNSTFEALAAGHRPVLVPRRTPRREQLIRAQRLAALGLADVVDERARATDVEALLHGQRRLPLERVADAGIALDGADRAATVLAGAAAGARR